MSQRRGEKKVRLVSSTHWPPPPPLTLTVIRFFFLLLLLPLVRCSYFIVCFRRARPTNRPLIKINFGRDLNLAPAVDSWPRAAACRPSADFRPANESLANFRPASPASHALPAEGRNEKSTNDPGDATSPANNLSSSAREANRMSAGRYFGCATISGGALGRPAPPCRQTINYFQVTAEKSSDDDDDDWRWKFHLLLFQLIGFKLLRFVCLSVRPSVCAPVCLFVGITLPPSFSVSISASHLASRANGRANEPAGCCWQRLATE